MRGMSREQLARAWRDFNKSLDVTVKQMPDRKFKCIHCGHLDEMRYDVADMLWEHVACECGLSGRACNRPAWRSEPDGGHVAEGQGKGPDGKGRRCQEHPIGSGSCRTSSASDIFRPSLTGRESPLGR